MTGTATAVEDAQLVYLFGVVSADARAVKDFGTIEGLLPNTRVLPIDLPTDLAVDHADLVGVACLVPADTFAAETFPAAVEDRDWLEARVLSHERVLEALLAVHDLVPFRFATICRDFAAARTLLVENALQLHRALAQVHGAQEWGVKLHVDPQGVRQALAVTSKAVRDLSTRITTSSAGQAYFLQKKLEKTLQSEVDIVISDSLEQVRARLGGQARECVGIAVRQSSGAPQRLAWKAAYLVDRQASLGFHTCLAELDGALRPSGLFMEVSGPWPPYHFVSSEPLGVAHA
jgi:hypothetical protein